MTDENKDLDLATLWQSEKGEIDMDMIMQHVQHGERLGKRFRMILYAFYAVSFALTAYLEWSGVFGTVGVLSAVLLMVYAASIFKMHRGRPDMAALTPHERLKYSLRRAKSNLLIVRMLSFYAPIIFVAGAGAGFLAGKVMGPSESQVLSGDAASILLASVLAGMSVIAFFGNRLAIKLRLEIAALEDRLELFESDV